MKLRPPLTILGIALIMIGLTFPVLSDMVMASVVYDETAPEILAVYPYGTETEPVPLLPGDTIELYVDVNEDGSGIDYVKVNISGIVNETITLANCKPSPDYPGEPENVVVNPSFESDGGWVYEETCGNALGRRTSAWATHGSYSYELMAPGAGYNWYQGKYCRIKQTVDLTNVDVVKFDAQVGGWCPACWEYRFYIDSTQKWHKTGGGTWKNQEIDVSGLTGTHILIFELKRDDAGWMENPDADTYFRIDNVRAEGAGTSGAGRYYESWNVPSGSGTLIFNWEVKDKAGNVGTDISYAIISGNGVADGFFKINGVDVSEESVLYIRTPELQFEFIPTGTAPIMNVEVNIEGTIIELTKSGDRWIGNYTLPGEGTYHINGYFYAGGNKFQRMSILMGYSESGQPFIFTPVIFIQILLIGIGAVLLVSSTRQPNIKRRR